MRLLTHNSLQNNSLSAKGKGYPLKITVAQIRVDDAIQQASIDTERKLSFVKGVIPTLDWSALVTVSHYQKITRSKGLIAILIYLFTNYFFFTFQHGSIDLTLYVRSGGKRHWDTHTPNDHDGRVSQ